MARVGLCGRWLLGWLCLLSAVGFALAAPDSGCSKYTNTSCEQCLSNVTCLWCSSTKECLVYPVRNILPPSSLCKLNAARWGVCWVNFEALIIAMSVVGGVLIIGLCVCCCCCCKKKKSRKPDMEDEKIARQNEQRRVRQEERRAEMKTRHDEIRKKYGLFKGDNAYTKFEN
ncbi:pituitary tumor-transforming gene 1 protein-interacting protein [Microcaecilia unicolor]|uniref:Pituitary tumor-transforming gene 1 protein-interacting protein n=1 Tax=Microcaecilia unicolor TaxID=1415580 RepID=A0A6P7YCC3_9AMPH|nr:pituitary tumor-transforming gene 1 protein-interacting protein [Microcaecilia unicolor]